MKTRPATLLRCATSAAVAALLITSCSRDGASSRIATAGESTGPIGVLAGRVTRGPLTPVQRADQPEPGSGVAGAELDINRADGTMVTSVKTDHRGNYRVSLPAGTYTLTMPSVRQYGAMSTKVLPATMRLAAGETKHFDIRLDTGIR